MEERLRFVARLLEGEAMADLAREFGISRKTGYKILNATRSTGSKRSATAPGGPGAMPTSCPHRSSKPSVSAPTGGRARFASSWSSASPVTSAFPPGARFMPCSTAMAL